MVLDSSVSLKSSHTKLGDDYQDMKHTSKQTSEINNPCLKEQELTYKCLNETNFNREQCANHYLNYNTCKEFWNKVRSDRRAQGITPYLPLPEDRVRIKSEYFKNAKTS